MPSVMDVNSLSPFASLAFQRAATFSFALADEVHSLVDAPAYVPRRLHPRVKKCSIAGLIFFGTLISTFGKLAYEIQAVGKDGASRPFAKPWFLVLLMFTGMSLNLPLSLFLDLVRSFRRRSKWLGSAARTSRHRAYEPLYAPLLQYDASDEEMLAVPQLESPVTPGSRGAALRFRFLDKQLLVLAVPTMLDLCGAALLNVGLLTVTASATQMLRQSLLLFAAVLGVVLWRKRLNKHHIAGLAGCLIGLMMVAAASLASGFGGSTASSHRGTMALGIGLILASQMVAAGQLLMDQSWYINRLQLSPLKVVGCEGLLGMVLMLLVVLPLARISPIGPEGWGLREDSWDSLVMIASRPLLLVLLLAYTGSLQGYNICGMVTTGELSAVETSLLQAVRTLFVWIINLLVYVTAVALTPDAADHAEPVGLLHASVTLAASAATAAEQTTTSSSSTNSASSTFSASAATTFHGHQPHALQQVERLNVDVLNSSLAAQAVAAAPEELMNPTTLFPGEPWMAWSFLQAGGFLILVLAAIVYNKGDNEHLRKQLQDEAALIMLDQPPSVAGSLASGAAGRHFMAHMDIDTAGFVRSFARARENALYGITPVPSQSYLSPSRAQSGGLGSINQPLMQQRSGSLTGVVLDDSWVEGSGADSARQQLPSSGRTSTSSGRQEQQGHVLVRRLSADIALKLSAEIAAGDVVCELEEHRTAEDGDCTGAVQEMAALDGCASEEPIQQQPAAHTHKDDESTTRLAVDPPLARINDSNSLASPGTWDGASADVKRTESGALSCSASPRQQAVVELNVSAIRSSTNAAAAAAGLPSAPAAATASQVEASQPQ